MLDDDANTGVDVDVDDDVGVFRLKVPRIFFSCLENRGVAQDCPPWTIPRSDFDRPPQAGFLCGGIVFFLDKS